MQKNFYLNSKAAAASDFRHSGYVFRSAFWNFAGSSRDDFDEKGIIAISDYNQLVLYEVYLECNLSSRDTALSMFNGLFSDLTRIYGSYSSGDFRSLGYCDINLYSKNVDEL